MCEIVTIKDIIRYQLKLCIDIIFWILNFKFYWFEMNFMIFKIVIEWIYIVLCLSNEILLRFDKKKDICFHERRTPRFTVTCEQTIGQPVLICRWRQLRSKYTLKQFDSLLHDALRRRINFMDSIMRSRIIW